jgi:hypothetical protein
MTRARLLVAMAAAVAVVWSGLPTDAGGPTPIRATAAQERFPAADSGYLAWSQVVGRKQHVRALVEGGSPFRVNAWANGATGGIDGSLLIYQEYARDRSDLKLYELDTRVRSNPPAGINTTRWEYWPDIDGGRILFGRLFPRGKRQVILYDPGAVPSLRVLMETQGGRHNLHPGQVNGDYVVWTRWRTRGDRYVDCEVFLHDLVGNTRITVPNPGNKCQFGASVAEDGTVFYGRSGYACGRSVKLMMLPPGGSPSTLVSFARGRDFTDSYTYAHAGQDHVLYDPASCSRPRQDIFEVTT